VTARAIGAVWCVEWQKLNAQRTPRAVLFTAIAAPFMFVVAIRLQAALPEDTLFGRGVRDSGFAVPLVVLGFAALWATPIVSSIVGGDIFSAEDRYGTWPSILTRSCTKTEVFVAKLLTAFAFSTLAIFALGASSMAAGLVGVGAQPLVDLSGRLLAPVAASRLVVLSWASVLPVAWGFTALAVLCSIGSRSSVVGVGVPVVAALAMQLGSYVDGSETARRLLLTAGFDAWHGFVVEPRYVGAFRAGVIVSGAYLVVCSAVAYRLFMGRDAAR
jgi:ABC-2 type transport system permease protein